MTFDDYIHSNWAFAFRLQPHYVGATDKFRVTTNGGDMGYALSGMPGAMVNSIVTTNRIPVALTKLLAIDRHA